jgi:integrase
MLRACRTPRDRAFVSVLYESAGRVAEVCRLRWKDVAFDQYSTKLYLDDTKTGRYRFVRLTLSTMALTALQNSYRGDASGESYVFTMRGKHSREPMTYNAVASLLCRVSKEAGVEKRVHPHLFRKTRITHMISQGYNTSVVMKAAWGTTDSHQMKTYLQLAEQDIDGEFLRKAGVAVEDEGNARRLEVKCPRCHTVNPPDNDCCGKCGMPLTADAEERIDLLWGDLWELVASNPEKAVEVARALSRRG